MIGIIIQYSIMKYLFAKYNKKLNIVFEELNNLK